MVLPKDHVDQALTVSMKRTVNQSHGRPGLCREGSVLQGYPGRAILLAISHTVRKDWPVRIHELQQQALEKALLIVITHSTQVRNKSL